MEHPPLLPPGPQQRAEILARKGQPAPAPAPYDITPPYGYDYLEQPDDSGSLLDYARILRRHKGTLLLIAFLGTLAAVLVTLPQTPVYQARTSLEIVELNENFLNIKQVMPISESGASAALTDIQTQIKILQSESLIERVLARSNIQNRKEGQGRIAAWRQALNLPAPAPGQESSVERARKNLKVRADGQTRMVEVLYDSTDPNLAADFANTLANEFIEQNMEARWKMSQRTGDWLTRQLDEMRIKLERSEDALQRYARISGLMFTSEKNNISEDKLRQLQEALSKAQADRVARQSRFEMANSSSPETLPDVLNDTALRDYQAKLTDLRRQRAELATTFTPEYSKVKRLEAQIASLESALDKERSAIIKRIRNEYDEALRRENLLAADYAKQARLVTLEAGKAIQYNILKRDLDSNRQLYEAMLQRMKEVSVASAMRASNVRVVDPAKPPRLPYKPNVFLNAALGLLTGLLLGVAFIIVRERADRTIQQPGDLNLYLNSPELGVIPSSKIQHHKSFYYPYRKTKPSSLSVTPHSPETALTKLASHNLEERLELVAWQRQHSIMAESFRAVLTSILFSGQNGDRPHVLVITSTGPLEGKTTVACNLAIALAEIHQRILLIDGDLRKPRLHEVFDLPNDCGLIDLLGKRKLAAGVSLKDVAQETAVSGLSQLPRGPPSAGATNLLYSPALIDLLRQARQEFDTVVIDTPPMLQIPDARVLGRAADAVILVVRAAKTTRDATVAAKQRFSEDGTLVVGTILDDWNPKSSAGGYHGSYHAHYKGYSRYHQTSHNP
jgi:succinoglycan biosynthesis transport protein ExoP